jgi:hypothetical protein
MCHQQQSRAAATVSLSPSSPAALLRGFVAKSFVGDIKAARELFFSPDLPEADLAR